MVTHAAKLAEAGFPNRKEFALWICQALLLTLVNRIRLAEPENAVESLVFDHKAQRVGFPGFEKAGTA